jgi:hypothetical protein
METQPKAGEKKLVQVSAVVPAAMRDGLKAWGGGNISEGIRLAVSEPHQSPSGAAWIQSPIQLQNNTGNAGPEVAAMPHGVVAHGITGNALLIDMEGNELCFIVPGGDGLAVEITLADLALIAGRLPAVVIACCDETINEFGHEIGGILCRALRPGLLEIRPGGPSGTDACAVVLPVLHALQLAAEVVSLLARRVELHQLTVCELNARIADPQPVEQEVA